MYVVQCTYYIIGTMFRKILNISRYILLQMVYFLLNILYELTISDDLPFVSHVSRAVTVFDNRIKSVTEVNYKRSRPIYTILLSICFQCYNTYTYYHIPTIFNNVTL